jgi:aspartyl-tRNA(Asn)/glutamyl-tRNA(Gln) amidotransferase subunit B
MSTTVTTATEFETVIGLEIHVELKTNSKLFCGCENHFGGAPNTQVCPVCLGLPGSLPVVNGRAVECHLLTALALGCSVPNYSKFDRKNYFYHDMPKNFQTSQFDLPLAGKGIVKIKDHQNPGAIREIGITRIHLEEDTGKSIHYRTINGQLVPDRLAQSEFSLIDYNRAGVPLMEIVSEPDMRNSQEAVDYLQAIREVLLWIGVSDCKMEEGSMRCDANVSVRPVGTEPFGTKAEVKNMNSFRSVKLAIDFEVQRQIELIRSGGQVIQETRGWDEGRAITISMRSKEEAHDYRYFPEPDLAAIVIEPDWLESLRQSLPELPKQKVERYQRDLQLSEYDANLLVGSLATAQFFEQALELSKSKEAKSLANLMINELSRLVQAAELEFDRSPVSPKQMAELVDCLQQGKISSKGAKELLPQLMENPSDESVEKSIERLGLGQMSDSGAIKEIVERIVQANPVAVQEYKSGKAKALNVLVGQVMKESKGRANPGQVSAMVLELLGSDS